MTTYKIAVKFADVDLITGIQIAIRGSIPGGSSSDQFAEAVTPVKSSAEFIVRGDGKRLKGLLLIEPTIANPTFIDNGRSYNVVDPGQYRVVVRNKKPTKLITIDLPRTSPVASSKHFTSTFGEPSDYPLIAWPELAIQAYL